MSDDERQRELLDLAQHDPEALLRIWRQAGGVPPGGKFVGDVDYEHTIIPAILAAERGETTGDLAPRATSQAPDASESDH